MIVSMSWIILEVVFHLLTAGEAGGRQTSTELFQPFREKTARPWNIGG